MFGRQHVIALFLSTLLVIPTATALGQIGRGVGGTGGRAAPGAARPGAIGARELSSPRSGRGIRSNPIVNPSPSLTPHEVLNPRGSLSSGQVLNPVPSLARPRSGGVATAGPSTGGVGAQRTSSTQQAVMTEGVPSRDVRSNRADVGAGDRMATEFRQLGAQLRRYKNGEPWAKYLALPQAMVGDAKGGTASEKAGKLLKRFDKLAGNPTYEKVSSLVEFQKAHASLKLAVASMGSTPPAPVAMELQLDADTALGTVAAPAENLPLGDKILQLVVDLDSQLAKVSPKGDWSRRLSLDELRILVSVTSEQPASDDERKSVEKILKAYQTVAKNDEDAEVNQLPDFEKTLNALQEYLSPLDSRQKD